MIDYICRNRPCRMTNIINMKLTKTRITSIHQPEFQYFWQLYQESFPEIERKDIQGIAIALAKEQFHNELFLSQGEPVAMLAYWQYPHFCYLEYIAVAPSQKGQGTGSHILQELLARTTPPVILEIEHVVDETTRRRQTFYERLGFVANPQHEHCQPPYQKGFQPLPMLLMTHPQAITDEAYREFYRILTSEIVAL